MTLASFPCRARVWIKTNIALFMITFCALIPLHTATSLASRSNHKNTSTSTVQGKWVNNSNQTAGNESSSVPTAETPNNSGYPLNDSLTKSTFDSEGFLENGELLVDPSYPISRTPSSNEIQVLKPSKIVSSSLLTAATPLPTAPPNNFSTNSGNYNHTSHGGNDTQATPVFSGSMTIAFPTPIPHLPGTNGTPNASISLSSLSSNTVVGFITADSNMSSTPTTSTQYVYATNAPITTSRTSTPMNSAGCHISTSVYRIIVSLVLIMVLAYSYS